MPFSPDEYKIDAIPLTDADILRKARALIDAPEKWIKGLSKVGDTYCAFGAIIHGAKGNNRHLNMFREANGLAMISTWNNKPERTHAEVMDAFDRAIALAETRAP